MSAPRHLGRVLDEILSLARARLKEDDLVWRLETIILVAEHLRNKAPEQIRPSAWDDIEGLIRGIAEALGEPWGSAVEEIWNGANTSSSTADPSALDALKSLEAIATGTGDELVIYQALKRLHHLESTVS